LAAGSLGSYFELSDSSFSEEKEAFYSFFDLLMNEKFFGSFFQERTSSFFWSLA
jgi:hypothetical protein